MKLHGLFLLRCWPLALFVVQTVWTDEPEFLADVGRGASITTKWILP